MGYRAMAKLLTLIIADSKFEDYGKEALREGLLISEGHPPSPFVARDQSTSPWL
jgi:hypothetical protein